MVSAYSAESLYCVKLNPIKSEMNDFQHIIFEKQGAIARIALNRPDAANGLDSLMAGELDQAARLRSCDPWLQAVVLTAKCRFEPGVT